MGTWEIDESLMKSIADATREINGNTAKYRPSYIPTALRNGNDASKAESYSDGYAAGVASVDTSGSTSDQAYLVWDTDEYTEGYLKTGVTDVCKFIGENVQIYGDNGEVSAWFTISLNETKTVNVGSKSISVKKESTSKSTTSADGNTTQTITGYWLTTTTSNVDLRWRSKKVNDGVIKIPVSYPITGCDMSKIQATTHIRPATIQKSAITQASDRVVYSPKNGATYEGLHVDVRGDAQYLPGGSDLVSGFPLTASNKYLFKHQTDAGYGNLTLKNMSIIGQIHLLVMSYWSNLTLSNLYLDKSWSLGYINNIKGMSVKDVTINYCPNAYTSTMDGIYVGGGNEDLVFENCIFNAPSVYEKIVRLGSAATSGTTNKKITFKKCAFLGNVKKFIHVTNKDTSLEATFDNCVFATVGGYILDNQQAFCYCASSTAKLTFNNCTIYSKQGGKLTTGSGNITFNNCNIVGFGMSASAITKTSGTILNNCTLTSTITGVLTGNTSDDLNSGGSTNDDPTITYNLTGCSSTETKTSVVYGGSYYTMITKSSGTSIVEESITMGGIDIKDQYFSNGVLDIPSVTDDVVITIKCE